MKLARRIERAIILMITATIVGVFGFLLKFGAETTFAEGDEVEDGPVKVMAAKHVTFYDNGTGEKLTVKTEAATVGEALERMGYSLNDGDKAEPTVETEIDADNFFINIYRGRPVVIRDGVTTKYVMTASYDYLTILKEAEIELLDGDEVKVAKSDNFLESGIATVYEIVRKEQPVVEEEVVEKFDPAAVVATSRRLTARMGVNIYNVVINGVTITRKETYYDLPMAGVMKFCGGGDYYVREDGVKVDAEGYVLVAANLNRYPRCSIVGTSLGLGKVYDTGAFAETNAEQFDLATDWTNRNGR